MIASTAADAQPMEDQCTHPLGPGVLADLHSTKQEAKTDVAFEGIEPYGTTTDGGPTLEQDTLETILSAMTASTAANAQPMEDQCTHPLGPGVLADLHSVEQEAETDVAFEGTELDGTTADGRPAASLDDATLAMPSPQLQNC
ncbi:unnamed protein product [Calypogeia fissa]